MKKVKLLFIGAISLVVFGLLLPQPIQALLVIIDTPVKNFFVAHALSLCVVVGLIQGISEEGGYYFVLRQISKKEQLKSLPFWFGLGRSLLHTLFDIGTIIIAFSNIWVFVLAIVSRMFSFVAMMKLTMLDYFSYQKKKVSYVEKNKGEETSYRASSNSSRICSISRMDFPCRSISCNLRCTWR